MTNDMPLVEGTEETPFERARVRAREYLLGVAAETEGRNPAGLLFLAHIVAVGQAQRETRRSLLPSGLTGAETRLEEAVDAAALAEALYDDLFDMLRSGGWLDCPSV